MKIEELKSGYYLFGNKGNVWSNACHIANSGNSLTLCGIPMLSNNWGRIENIQEIGCPKCLKKYEEDNEIDKSFHSMFDDVDKTLTNF
jgi:hypothetical protein